MTSSPIPPKSEYGKDRVERPNPRSGKDRTGSSAAKERLGIQTSQRRFSERDVTQSLARLSQSQRRVKHSNA